MPRYILPWIWRTEGSGLCYKPRQGISSPVSQEGHHFNFVSQSHIKGQHFLNCRFQPNGLWVTIPHDGLWWSAPCTTLMPFWEPLETASRLCWAHDPLHWPLQTSKCFADFKMPCRSNWKWLLICRHNVQFDKKFFPVASNMEFCGQKPMDPADWSWVQHNIETTLGRFQERTVVKQEASCHAPYGGWVPQKVWESLWCAIYLSLIPNHIKKH